MLKLPEEHPELHQRFQDGFHVVRRSDKYWAGLSCDLTIEQTLMRSLKTSGGLTRGSGMTDTQRNLWTQSMPHRAAINLAMQESSGVDLVTSVQHETLRPARLQRDCDDASQLFKIVTEFSPFAADPSLRNAVTGEVAGDDVNVDSYKSVGIEIIKAMHGKSSFSHKFKRSEKAKTMGTANKLKVDKDTSIDPTVLFQRFLIIQQNVEINTRDVFKYELAPYPPALFARNYVMLTADKPKLKEALIREAILTRADPSMILDKEQSDEARQEEITEDAKFVYENDNVPRTDRFVIDGGYLLHKLLWPKGVPFQKIVDGYTEYTIRHYDKADVVFDGYDQSLSTKSNTHEKRRKFGDRQVNFNLNTECKYEREDFLSNTSNKKRLIAYLSDEFRNLECNVAQCTGDADTTIVETTLKLAESSSVTLIGEDTDLLVLLLFHLKDYHKEVFFRSDKKGISKAICITTLKEAVGDEICQALPFLHAFTGCDTVSRIANVGKKAIIQKFKKSEVLKTCAKEFIKPDQDQDKIEEQGRMAMLELFGGKNVTLSELRDQIFKKKVATSTKAVKPSQLPPTKSATYFHSLRAYHQVNMWTYNEYLNPCEWGWEKEENNGLHPFMTGDKHAPEELLKIIRCNCKTECGNRRCSCRKADLPCTPACGPCQVDGCDNVAEAVSNTSIDDEGDIDL